MEVTLRTARETPESGRRVDAPARDLLQPGDDWAERIKRARDARELGRKLREGKPPIANSPRTVG